MEPVVILVFYLLVPALVIFLCHRYPFFNKIGSVVIIYVLGVVVGNSGLLPQNIHSLQNMLVTITIPLAIPLLLFSMNVRRWFKIAPKTLLSMFFAFIGVVGTTVLGFFLFRDEMPDDMWQVAGLLVGVYTGGTPNMASIKVALGVDETLYLATHTYDLVVGVCYLIFMLTIGQRVFALFLPRFRFSSGNDLKSTSIDGMESWVGFFTRESLISLSKASGIALLIFAAGGSLILFLPENAQMAAVIIAITTLGIGASLIPAVNRLQKTFEAGMYLILVFSLVVSSMANFKNLSAANPIILAYVTLVIFGSLLIQVLLSRLFKVDTDTTMITSTAFICSPPFVPVVAAAIRNKEVIISGLTVGIIGYAIGNYLGVTLAYLLH